MTKDPRCQKWRRTVEKTFTPDNGFLFRDFVHIRAVDPSRGDCLREGETWFPQGRCFHRDIQDIAGCDYLLLVWWGDPGRQSIGTWAEMGYAHGLGLPIFVVDISEEQEAALHPFVQKMATEIFDNLQEALDFLLWLTE